MSASKNVTITIPKSEKEMIAAFQALVSCVCQDESRYYIVGIHFQRSNSEDGAMNLVSTDGHCLFNLVVPKDYISGLPSNWIGGTFPVPVFGSKAKSLWNGKGSDLTAFSIELSKGKDSRTSVWNMGNGSSYTTREIDGTFPDYRPVIPKDPLMEGANLGYTIALMSLGKRHESLHIESSLNGTTLFLEDDGGTTPLLFDEKSRAEKLSYGSFHIPLLQRLKPLAESHQFPLRWSIKDQVSPMQFVGGRSSQDINKGPLWEWRYVVMPKRCNVDGGKFEYLTQEGWSIPTEPACAPKGGGKADNGEVKALRKEAEKLRKELKAAKAAKPKTETKASDGEVKALRKELQVLQRAQRVEVETSRELDEENKALKAELIGLRKQLELDGGPSPLPLSEAHVEVEVDLWEPEDVNFNSGVMQAFFEVDEDGEIILKVALSGYGSTPLDLREFEAAAKAAAKARGMEKVWVCCDPSCLIDTPEPIQMEDGTIQA